MTWALTQLVGIWALLSALCAFYLAALTLLARLAPQPPGNGKRGDLLPFFSIMVPAHDEERLLGELIASLSAMDYPKDRFRVHVVADNCGDRTAAIARAAGFDVHERFDTTARGKGHALDWLTERLHANGNRTDYVVIVDADSRLSPNFLSALARRVATGAHAVQVHYAVADPGQSWAKALRGVAMLLINYVRPQGRSTFGASAGVKGTGMMFSQDVLHGRRWGASLAEDAQLNLDLVLKGIKVVFAPEATVLGHVPSTLKGAEVQNERWEAGRLSLVAHYGPLLLSRFFRKGDLAAADALVDLLVPPLSVVGLSIATCVAISPFLTSAGPMWISSFALVCLVVHVVWGMSLAGASRVHYVALAMAPLFVLWKTRLYIPIFFGRRPSGWIKTERD